MPSTLCSSGVTAFNSAFIDDYLLEGVLILISCELIQEIFVTGFAKLFGPVI